jgi:hypothetical protein
MEINMSQTIKKDIIIQKIADIVGTEKAYVIFYNALQDAQLGQQGEYTKENVLKIVEALKQNGGMISISASLIAAEVHLNTIGGGN